MSLDFVNLLPQVDMLVDSTISRHKQADALIPDLLKAFESIDGAEQELLLRKLELAGDVWPAAMPSNEPVQETYPPPESRSKFNVIATDGSQIHPDRHSPAYYYLINIGRFSLQHGSGTPPDSSSLAKIYFDEDELYDEFGSAVSTSVINGKRDVLELESLAILAEDTNDAPSLALLDNGLLLWIAAQGGEPRSRVIEKLLLQYMKHLSCIQKSNASLAGFIDRPRHWNAVALLALTSLPLDEVGKLTVKSNPYRSISDRIIFKRILKPGYRSSLFIQRSKLNTEFRSAGQEIYFFYLHTDAGDNIVRVEVPEWVAKSKDHLDTVHDSLLEQCKQTAGYPYALIRAHELAVVSNIDRQNFEALIQSRLLEGGVRFTHSQKAETKRWTREKRRHRL
jgi:hypothetical protein